MRAAADLNLGQRDPDAHHGSCQHASAGGQALGGSVLASAAQSDSPNDRLGGQRRRRRPELLLAWRPPISQGHNLEAPAVGSFGQCGTSTGAEDRFSVDAALAPLADRGGPTHTHALLSSSLIDVPLLPRRVSGAR